jgi:hypothetical protein
MRSERSRKQCGRGSHKQVSWDGKHDSDMDDKTSSRMHRYVCTQVYVASIVGSDKINEDNQDERKELKGGQQLNRKDSLEKR